MVVVRHVLCEQMELHIVGVLQYLVDYASPETRKKGEALIQQSLMLINNVKIRQLTEQHLTEIETGERDFRF